MGTEGTKTREAPVLQFFNNKRGDEGFFNLGQRRLPDVLLIILSRQSLCQTPKEGVAWYLLKRISRFVPERSPRRSADGNTDEETDNQDKEKRENVFSGEPFRKQHGERPCKTR